MQKTIIIANKIEKHRRQKVNHTSRRQNPINKKCITPENTGYTRE